jgi:hypothetical protein
MEPATGPDALSVTHSRSGHRPNFPAGEARPGRERPEGSASAPLPGVELRLEPWPALCALDDGRV